MEVFDAARHPPNIALVLSLSLYCPDQGSGQKVRTCTLDRSSVGRNTTKKESDAPGVARGVVAQHRSLGSPHKRVVAMHDRFNCEVIRTHSQDH